MAAKRTTKSSSNDALLQTVIDTIVDGVIIIDTNGSIRTYNRACRKLFGHPASKVVGRNVNILMPPPYREEHDQYLQSYLETGKRKIIGIGRDVIGLRKDGTTFPMHLSVGEGNIDGERFFVGMIHDLTERRSTEEQLRQAQKMEAIGQLTGGLAHDFNNLLTVIMGNLEMIEERSSDEEMQGMLLDAKAAADSGAELTARLLAFARRQPLEAKAIDLNKLVVGMRSLLNRTLGDEIKISTVLAHDLSNVRADRGQVENAVLNLAINARDAMPNGGTLVIETKNVELDDDYAAAAFDVIPGRYVLISVTDTGKGMPPEIRARALEPFFTTKEVGAGTGLGLSMAYGFVKQSGGHLQIYSEIGRGTSVNLYLPRIDGAADPTDERETSLEDYAAKGETVLVAEDDERVRRITVSRLKGLGYEVLDAADGPTALSLVEQTPAVDLLFTDVVMPGGLSGQELARAARRLRPNLKVLFTSGYAREAIADSGLLTDEGGLLRKPYRKADLAAKIRSVLDSS